ncbi:MAG TPA: peptide-methionine (S)-S-oxide reductase MsrA [Steroidobacteraceae bacterium]|jgi:peptide-methionine (S)-S-oxide reductase
MAYRFPMLAAAAVATASLAGALIVGVSRQSASATESQALAPAPTFDQPLAKTSGSETAILSGGCFWGVQIVFQHVQGVREVVSGYTGGERGTAHYEDVGTGATGHAESVRIAFDPHVVSYGTLLRIYFSVVTDPTQLDHQGPDLGAQYRSEIWPLDEAQRRVAEAYLAQLRSAHLFPAPIVTRIESARPFYAAEAYHQDFATLHPHNLYIMTFDAPKVAALARGFPALYVARPTLVSASSTPNSARQEASR